MDERETGSLIGSDKVEGPSVYERMRAPIGTIERDMIDKQSGKVPLLQNHGATSARETLVERIIFENAGRYRAKTALCQRQPACPLWGHKQTFA